MVLAVATIAGCDGTPATTKSVPSADDTPAVSEQDELVKQKLTIEQAAEEATKLVEADAKAEIDAALSITSEPAQ
jgi:hypothetical protein